MSAIWWAVICLAGWWMNSVPFFARQVGWTWEWLAAGLALCMIARTKVYEARVHPATLLLTVALVGLALLAPPETARISWVLAAAYTLCLLLSRAPRFQWVSAGTMTAAAIVGVQALASSAFEFLGPRMHDLSAAIPVVAATLRLLGINAGQMDGRLVLAQPEGAFPVELGWEHAGLLMMMAIFLGAIPVALLHRRRPLATLAAVAALVVGYAFVRLVVVASLYAMWSDPSIFSNASVVSLSFLPLAFLLSRWLPIDDPLPNCVPVSPFPGTWRWAKGVAACAAASALLTVAVSFHDPGIEKQGRILVDEGHSDWEWTDEPLDTKTYGLRSTYNYYNLFDHLGKLWKVERTRSAIEPGLLARSDVLIVKMPTKPFEDDEIQALEEYVRGGGGLWLIGDHTDVFGSTSYLNPVSETFGIRYVGDCLYDQTTGSLNTYQSPTVGAHPVTSHLPPFLFATGCSIVPDLDVESAMTGVEMASLRGDYAQRNFFPAAGPRTSFGFGTYCEMAARTYGKGRVLAFTDSTVFSNFFFFLPGKAELAVASVDWLNRENRFPSVRWICLLLGSAASSLIVAWIRRQPVSWAFAAVALGVLGGNVAAQRACDLVTASAYPPIVLQGEKRWVTFDLDQSGIFLPIERLQTEHDNDFSTFFVWTQRLGYTPYASRVLGECLDRSGVHVLADPSRELSNEDVTRIVEYVRGGGGLVVLVRGGTTRRSTESLLDALGLQLGSSFKGKTGLAAPFASVSVTDGRDIIGGDPLARTKDGVVVAAARGVGRGRVVACSVAGVFPAAVMGPVGVVPGPTQLEIFDLEYALLRSAMGEPASKVLEK